MPVNNETPYFEDIEVGTNLPVLEKRPDEVQLFAFSAATWDTHRIHWDTPYTKNEEHMENILVHGHLQGSFLGQVVTDWAGPRSRLRKLGFQNRGMAYPNDVLTCTGKVTEKSLDGNVGIVTCELWVENQHGGHPTTGEAVIELPLRDSA